MEPVQVIEVPKIFPDRVHQRIVERRPPQTAEQLVEVPTIISYSSLQRTVEQFLMIVVARAVEEAFKAFLQDRALQRTVEQILLTSQFQVVEGETSAFKVFLPDRVQQRIWPLMNAVLSGLWSRSLIPVSRGFGGGLQDFRPGQGPTASSDFLASSSVSPGHADKKSPNSPASQSSDLLEEVSPWTPAAYGAPMVAEPLTVAELEDMGG